MALERREYDNATYPYVWMDGFGGEMWLSRGSCLEAEIEQVEHEGYCPHGGDLVANTTSGQDTRPHPLCSRFVNISYDVVVDEESWVRALSVAPGAGRVDDLGYGELMAEIVEWEAVYDREMHYPAQLQILATLGGLRRQAEKLAFENATWRRSWTLRTCLSSATADGLDGEQLGGPYYVTVYASHAMARKDRHYAHNGLFALTLLQTSFSRAPLASGVSRRGCLRRGGAEVFALADLPVPAWLIPPPLVRWALPLVFKKMVPLLAWLGKCEERTARGEESPFGDRVRDDVDGFYAAVRACLRGP